MLPVQRADMFRYAALWVHGGIYADLDVADRAPLCQWLWAADGDVRLVVGVEGVMQDQVRPAAHRSRGRGRAALGRPQAEPGQSGMWIRLVF